MSLEAKFGAFLGVLCLWFSTFYGFVSVTSENCTMGMADSLWMAAPCAVVSAFGWYLVYRINTSKLILPFLVPALLGGIWQSWFFLKLAKGHFIDGVSACFVITGYHPEHDDRIIPFIFLWGIWSLVFWLGCYLALRPLFNRGTPKVDH